MGRLLSERSFVIALWIVGFGLRWLFADGDYFSDEAWYFYLSRTFGSEPGAQGDHPWFHLLNRPLFYLLFHPSTYAGLYGFRLMGTAVGASVPVLSFLAARRFGARFLLAAFTASCLCVQAIELRYSGLVFPDPLAAAFAVAACWAVAAEASVLAQLLALCSVGSKESFLVVPMMIALVDLMSRRERGRSLRFSRAQWLLLLLPIMYVGGLTLLAITMPSLSMQGWSKDGFTLQEARKMWVGWETWPLLAWLMWRREGRILVLWLGLPVFYWLWNHVLGRGLAPWYAVGPAAVASVAAALGLDAVSRGVRSRQLQYALVAVCAGCLLPNPAYGFYKVRQQWLKIGGHFPAPDGASRVVAAIERRKPEDVLLIDCFWAFRYSHLRGIKPATVVHWGGAQDTEDVLKSCRAAPLIVACMPDSRVVAQSLRAEPFEIVYEDRDYLVLINAARASAAKIPRVETRH